MPEPSRPRPHPARRPDVDSFRRLVEQRISSDEYVRNLERRVDERRQNGDTGRTQAERPR